MDLVILTNNYHLPSFRQRFGIYCNLLRNFAKLPAVLILLNMCDKIQF